MARIGFIGLGIMGAPMAGHLIAAGHTLYAFTHGSVPHTLITAGAIVSTNAADVAGKADIIFLIVQDTPY
ncbi:MAG: NAD(P)-binding domain-containing protein, partial [Azonexus sp.]|nr:NAD(P)-binding domain-containing protein [Azonexus sp.]